MHEEGGWPEADLLQAADSLSFLDTLTPLAISWVRSGRATPERAKAKIRSSLDRIDPSLERARELARPMLAEAMRRRSTALARRRPRVSDTRGIVRAGQPAADAAAPTPEHVLAGAALIRDGRMYRLARERFPKMPLWPGHPTFEVVSYRTPHGSRVTGDHHWGLPNDACLGFMSELVIGTTHSGAHIDAHAHMTVGDEDRWHGGSARTDLGDFGPVVGDATEIPPLWRRGVLYDVPGHRGVTALPAGEPMVPTNSWPSRPPRAWRPVPATSRSSAPATCRAGPIRTASPRAAAPVPTSRPPGCCSSAGSSPPARTPRPTRSSRRRTVEPPPTPSPCTRCC